MKYSFHPEAKVELNEAVDYYNGCRSGLGSEFAREVYIAIQNILAHPEAWTPLSKHSRRCLVHRFPYGVIYQITAGRILIVAIMQLNRRPGYWKGRE